MDLVYRRSYRGPLKAVILDWAGTTVDFGCVAPAAVFVEVFRRAGVELSLEQARGPMGMHKRAHIQTVLALPEIRERWQRVHGQPPDEVAVQGLYDAFLPLQQEVIAQHATLIPGTLEAIEEFRRRGLLIGSCTGYTEALMEALLPVAAAQGYAPDCLVCGAAVPAGRPAPWMALMNAMKLGVYPLEACVKVGDTPVDVEEGLNAGMWTVALAVTGNEVGLSQAELEALAPEVRAARMTRARTRLAQAGAHYVVDGLAEVPAVLDLIEARLRAGEKP